MGYLFWGLGVLANVTLVFPRWVGVGGGAVIKTRVQTRGGGGSGV